MQSNISIVTDHFTSPLDCLQSVFGYSAFKPLQEAAISTAMSGRDALIILPTGGGKSMCYQIPALCTDRLTLVISPLIALMNDQVLALRQHNIPAFALHTNVSPKEKYVIHDKLESGELKLLYVSPEKVMAPSFLSYITGYPVRYIAIDEAHCVSVWGNDFRPEYTKLSTLRDYFPKATFLALTATADAATQKDIANQLALVDPIRHLGSFERENIFVEGRPGIQRFEQIMEYLDGHRGEAGIIYCLSRKGTENIAGKLKAAGQKVDFYHAGLNAQQRNDVQAKFQNDEINIVCATIAFGMGIDKSNIRWIIHYNMPKNLEGFYQEIGRAGRDDLPASSLLFYGWGDYMKLQRFIDESEADEKFKEIQTAKLSRMWEFASTGDCRTNVILNYFDEYRNEGCNHCDNCINPPKKFNGTILAQKAISALLRSKEKIGLNLLIDVLRGSKRRQVVELGLHNIKTYGAGADLSFLEWKSYVSQMINQGLIRVDYIENFSLKTTPLSRDVLNGNKHVEFVEFVIHEKREKVRIPKKTKRELFHEGLLIELKNWRLEKARRIGTPPYTIFHDSSLEALIKETPTLINDLKNVHGFGEAKVAKFGEEIIQVIRGFIEKQDYLKKVKGYTYVETLSLYEKGISVDEIAKHRALSPGTIYSHLAHLYEQGESVNIAQFVSKDQLALIASALEKLGENSEYRELRSHLPDDFPLHLISLGRLLLSNKE